MTEHKPMPVAGYTAQSDAKLALVNRNKQLEESVLTALDDLMACPLADQRWLAIARTQIEQGFMAFNRAIFQPQRLKVE